MSTFGNINIEVNNQVYVIAEDIIRRYADFWGLNRLIPNRYSCLFVAKLMVNERFGCITPDEVLYEVMALEGKRTSTTKTETMFERQPLKGFYHKHFFYSHPSAWATNTLNELGKHGLRSLVEDVFNPTKADKVTEAMIEEMSHRLTTEPLESRHAKGKLTGEWIIFTKHDFANYYLDICSHKAGDENIASNLKSICTFEFTFVGELLNSRP